MRRLATLLVTLALTTTSLWAPSPSSSNVEIVSAAPTGGCQSNVVKLVKTSGVTGGDLYACLGGSWTRMPIGVAELSATNSSSSGLCPRVSSTDTTKFEWFTCGSGGGSGTSTIQESGTTVNSTATILNFGSGLDISSSTTVSTNDTANVTIDYVENPPTLGTTEIDGTLGTANGGTGATTASAARSALGAAASGANSDILSLTGLTTALGLPYGGTGLTTASSLDDKVLLGQSGGTTTAYTAVPNCTTGNQLLYTAATNTFSCEADGAGASGLEASEEGVDVTAAARNRINFIGGAITAADNAGSTRIDITLSQSPAGATSVVGTTRTLTGGAGLAAIGDLSADRTLSTASQEAAFFLNGGTTDLTCTGSQGAGSAQTMDSGVLQTCDGSAIIRRHPFGDASGNALTGDSGTSFFQTGAVEILRGGTGATALGAANDVPFNTGSALGVDTGVLTYNSTTDVLSAGAFQSANATDGTRGSTFQDNTVDPSTTAASFTFLFAKSGEFYKKDNGDTTTNRLMLNDAVVTGDVTFNGSGVSAIGADKLTEAMVKAVDAAADEECLTYESTVGDFEWQACNAGGGITGLTADAGGTTTGTTVTLAGGTNGIDTSRSTDTVTLNLDTTEIGTVTFGSGSTFNWTFNLGAGTDPIFTGTDGALTATGFVLDAEGTGNTVTTTEKVWFAAGGCNNATASSFYDLPTANPGAAACITGTNTQKGVLDFDAATEESGQVSIMLPSDFVAGSNLDATFKWLAAATAGDVIWAIQTSCVADAETDDPSWNTASTVTDTAKGTTLQTNDATITNITKTGCATGELLHLRIFRQAAAGGDTMTGDARLIGVEFTYRRAQ